MNEHIYGVVETTTIYMEACMKNLAASIANKEPKEKIEKKYKTFKSFTEQIEKSLDLLKYMKGQMRSEQTKRLLKSIEKEYNLE